LGGTAPQENDASKDNTVSVILKNEISNINPGEGRANQEKKDASNRRERGEPTTQRKRKKERRKQACQRGKGLFRRGACHTSKKVDNRSKGNTLFKVDYGKRGKSVGSGMQPPNKKNGNLTHKKESRPLRKR